MHGRPYGTGIDFYWSCDVNWATNSRLAYVFGDHLTVHNPTPFYWAQVFAGSAVMSGSACFVLGRLMLVDFRGVWI